MKLKKSLACLITAMFLSTVPLAYAASFTDLQGYGWASPYITDVNGKNIIAGYPDGTFKPGNSVTRIESFVMLANLYPKEEIDKIYSDNESKYRQSMADNDIDMWARPFVVFALEKGIIPNTPEMMRALVDKASKRPIAAMRYELCVFLVRALGMENELDSGAKLEYKDNKNIIKQAVSYIELLQRKGVISKQGDGTGNFNPNKGVTRAETAVMLSKAYKYSPKAKNASTPQIKESVEEGVIQLITLSDGNITISAKDDRGATRNYTVDKAKLQVTRDSAAASYGDLKVGQKVKFVLSNGSLSKVEIASQEQKYSGEIIDIDTQSKIISIELNDGSVKRLKYDENSQVYVNDVLSKAEDLQTKYEVDVYCIDDLIKKVSASQKSGTAEGKILDYTDNIITLSTKDGNKAFKITSDTKVVRNSKKLSNIYQTAIGDSVKLSYVQDTANSIDIKTERNKYFGAVIKAIEMNTSYNKILIGDKDGNEHALTVNSDTIIRVDDKKATVYDLKLGYEVDVYADGGLVDEITSSGSYKQMTLNGIVSYVDTVDKYIDIKTGNGDKIRVNYTNDTIVEKLSNARTVDPRILLDGDKVTCIGVMNGGNLSATRVIADIQ